MKENIYALLAILFILVVGFVFGFLFGDQYGWNRYYTRQKTDECKRMKVNNEEFIPSYCYDYLK